jgi:stearoyl-CoA desaturase (delta-9 desaturase)
MTALLTYGEGFHNFHHQFPVDYRNGVRFYHFDPTKWIIRSLAWLGLARNLRRIPDSKIFHYQLQVAEQLLAETSKRGMSLLAKFGEHLDPMRQRIQQVLQRVEELEKEYHGCYSEWARTCLKKKDYLALKVSRLRLKAACREFQIHWRQWCAVL